MNHEINHHNFARARTPGKLQEIFQERANYSYVLRELLELLVAISDIRSDEFANDEFYGRSDNGEVFNRLECYAEQAMAGGYELICLIELWRGRHELGDGATLVELPESHRVGTMAVQNGEITVRCDDVADTQAVGCGDPIKLGRSMLRKLASERYRWS